MRLKAQLLAVSTAYCAASGLTEAKLSRVLFGAASRLKSLRDGKKMLSDNIEDALQTISDRWPEGAEWPCSVTRPAPSPSAGVDDPQAPPAD